MEFCKSTIVLATAVLMAVCTVSLNAAYVDPPGRASLSAQTLTPSGGDDSSAIQVAVDQASAQGGGRIILTAGLYKVRDVLLKSNVHFEIDSDATIEVAYKATGGVNVFSIGKEVGSTIQNVSFRGVGGRFKIIYPSSHTNPTRSFLVGNAENLFIQDVDITENYTERSAIAFVLQTNGTDENGAARNITVNNASLNRSLYGYGLVQVNVGRDMLFTNLTSTDAGVALRLEADLDVNNTNNIGIHNIVASDITAFKAHCAVFMQPHSTTSGLVQIDGVTAVECGVGVFSRGNIDRFPGLPDGSWAAGSYVRDISVLYGTQTPVKPAKINFMPVSLRSLVPRDTVPYDPYRVGPSAAAVVNELYDQVVITVGDVAHSGPNVNEYCKIVTATFTAGNGCSNTGGYTSWAPINVGGQAIDSDFDLDGVKNGIEYFMGEVGRGFTAQPQSNSSGTITWPMGAAYLGTYGTDYYLEYSTPDLNSWLQVPVGQLNINTGTSVEYTMPMGSISYFVRLVALN